MCECYERRIAQIDGCVTACNLRYAVVPVDEEYVVCPVGRYGSAVCIVRSDDLRLHEEWIRALRKGTSISLYKCVEIILRQNIDIDGYVRCEVSLNELASLC